LQVWASQANYSLMTILSMNFINIYTIARKTFPFPFVYLIFYIRKKKKEKRNEH